MCTVCNAEGHLQSNCPEEQLPPARPLPPMPPQHREVVIDVCYRTMMFYQPKEPELRARDRLVKDLEFFIQQKCSFPTARIDVFGSSHNGFAFECSDLDISLTFTDRYVKYIICVKRCDILVISLSSFESVSSGKRARSTQSASSSAWPKSSSA
jgi:hypothetical protein